MYVLMKALEIKFAMPVFGSNTILTCFVFYFLIIDTYFLIPAVIAQMLNSTSELAMPMRIATSQKKQKEKSNHIQYIQLVLRHIFI